MKKFFAFICVVCVVVVSQVFGIGVASANTPKKVTILMYHSIVNDDTKRGDYNITPAQLESDIQYLLDNGYEIATISDLVDYTKGKRTLGDNVAVLTFDDGFYNNYKYAVPLIDKYKVKGVFAIVGGYADDENLTNKLSRYAYMTWDDIAELAKINSVEIASHTYNLHGSKKRVGVKKLRGESDEMYKNLITNDFTANDNKLTNATNKKAVTFVYPYGIYNDISENVLESLGYKATLTCNEGVNYISRNSNLKLLKRYNRSGKYTTKKFMSMHNI